MGLFDWLFGGREKKTGAADEASSESYPWDEHPSIYEHIRSHVLPGQQELTEGWEKLPDEEKLACKSKIRWAAGALDGVMGHHMGSGDGQQEVERAFSLIQEYCTAPTVHNKAKVYQFLLESETLGFIDQLVGKLIGSSDLNHARLYELAHSLATESPDRCPVKFGLAILGLFRGVRNEELFHTLGRHDEFTLFCAVALSNVSENPEAELWRLARYVHGWGRVQTVERLAGTDDPRIKDWLLREGYKNSVMYEYLACICARSGGLLAALSKDEVDQELLTSAAEIIQALITGGPAQDIHDYEDGAAVVELYLGHLHKRSSTLQHFLSVGAISRFLTDAKAQWDVLVEHGWTPEKRSLLSGQCSTILGHPQWRELIRKGLEAEDRTEFARASSAAEELNMDTWEHLWRRLQESPYDRWLWWSILKQCDQERIGIAIAFAEEHWPLEKVATGPGKEVGLGPGYEVHSCLDCILQELEKHPGIGATLVEAALKSPVIRNRNGATRVLSAWGRDSWPSNIESALEQAVAIEPEEDVRARMERALSGQPLENA